MFSFFDLFRYLNIYFLYINICLIFYLIFCMLNDLKKDDKIIIEAKINLSNNEIRVIDLLE